MGTAHRGRLPSCVLVHYFFSLFHQFMTTVTGTIEDGEVDAKHDTGWPQQKRKRKNPATAGGGETLIWRCIYASAY
jgi:hypothetical protein